MRFARRALRMVLLAALFSATTATWAPPAEASFHMNKVREVYTGGADPNSQYVELQMYAHGQHQIGGHILKLYDASGSVTDCPIPRGVPIVSDQSHILFSTAEADAEFPAATPDFLIPPLLSRSGGAVCFENIDCVSWGSFAGTTASPSSPPFPGGIPSGMSIDRDISAGDPSTLEDTDDTNSSQDDFDAEAPSPEPNELSGPSDMNCGIVPPPLSVQDLKTKVKGGKVTVTGRLDPPGAGPVVKVSLLAKGSPFKKVDFAVDGLDAQTRFKVSLDVPDDAKRCKTLVKYRGDVIAQKTFGC